MFRLKDSRYVLGSHADIIVRHETESQSRATIDAVWERLAAFQAQFSRFEANSELSRCNAAAGTRFTISDEFYQLVLLCQHFHDSTKGIFNPCILPALQQAGYQGSWPQVAQSDVVLDYRHRRDAAFSTIELTPTTITLPADMALDFGGIGKGYALDIAADLVSQRGCEHYYLSFGGDIVCQGFDVDEQPWQIGIINAADNAVAADYIVARTGEKLAVASSGTTKRRGENWHHLIDPRTGQPSTSTVVMATVVAHRGVAVDVYAKTLVIDPDFAPLATLHEQYLQTALLQHHDGSHERLDPGGWLASTQTAHR